MRLTLLAAALTLAAVPTSRAADVPAGPADLIVHGAKVVTVDAKFTVAEAVAVAGGKIVAVGSSADVLKQKAADPDEAYQLVMGGVFVRNPNLPERRGRGKLGVDLDKWGAVDTGVKARGKVFIGFALETRREEENARAKLVRKGLDMIVANGPASLASGRIRATLIGHGWKRRVPLTTKALLARAVIAEVGKLLEPRA